MKKRYFLYLALAALPLCGADIPGVPRDSNNNFTGGYDSTRVHAQLVLSVKDDTQAVHFVRDNNDPRVVTKTYILQNVDPYTFREYLRQMVQSKRVGNTPLFSAESEVLDRQMKYLRCWVTTALRTLP